MTTHPSIPPKAIGAADLAALTTLAAASLETCAAVSLRPAVLAGLLGHIAALTTLGTELRDALDTVVRCPEEGLACADCAHLAATALADAREAALFGEGASQ